MSAVSRARPAPAADPWWLRLEHQRRELAAPTVDALRAARFEDSGRAAVRARALDLWDARPAAWPLDRAGREAMRTDLVVREARKLLEVPGLSTVGRRLGLEFATGATADDVLALTKYRDTWAPWVTSTARAALFVQAEAQKVAQGGDSALLNPDLWSAAPADKAKIAAALALQMGKMSTTLVGAGTGTAGNGCWNAWANTPASVLLTESSQILYGSQQCAMAAGNMRSQILQACPKLPATDTDGKALLSPLPTTTIQTSVIAAVQTAELIAQGMLELIGWTVQGGAQFVGTVAKKAADTVAAAASALSSPVVWAAGIGLGLVVLLRK